MTIAFTWLWQGLALAGLTVLLLRALPQLNAATRHAMWWAALVSVLCIPLVLAAGAGRDVLPGLPPAPESQGVQPALVLPPAPGWVGLLCASTWLLAALFGLVRVVHGCREARTLRKTSTPFDAAREGRLLLWSDTRARARCPASLRISEGLAGACAVGFRRPVIVVGRTLVERLDDAALDQVVMHEYAHLARYDDWLQLFQAIARAVGGLHPAVGWLSRHIDLDREAACDDYVVARTGAARQYAMALLEAAVVAGAGPAVPAVVPGATLRTSALRLRVARLLDPARASGTRATPMAAVGLVLPLIAILAGPRVAPLVAFVEAVELALPVPGVAVYRRPMPALPQAATAGADTASQARARVSGQAASSSASRRPEPPPAAPGGTDEPLISAATPEPPTVLGAVAPPPIESRRVFERVDARLLSAAPAVTMNGFSVPAPPARNSGQALVTSSLSEAKGAAAAVASGAEGSGIAIGRAFARAGQTIAGKF